MGTLKIKKLKMKLYLQLVTCVLSITNYGNIRPGACPELPRQPNFDVDRYMGQWHNYLANDVKNIPDNAECTTATYAVLNEQQISVNNSVALIVDVRDNVVPILSWAAGEATVVNGEPTSLFVNLYEFGGCGKLAVFCGGFEPDSDEFAEDEPSRYFDETKIYENYRVTETDYENYTIVISCYPVPGEDSHSEITYIMTRDRNWGPNNRDKVEEILARVRSWGIEIDSLHETDQTNCDQYEGLIP